MFQLAPTAWNILSEMSFMRTLVHSRLPRYPFIQIYLTQQLCNSSSNAQSLNITADTHTRKTEGVGKTKEKRKGERAESRVITPHKREMCFREKDGRHTNSNTQENISECGSDTQTGSYVYKDGDSGKRDCLCCSGQKDSKFRLIIRNTKKRSLWTLLRNVLVIVRHTHDVLEHLHQ